MTRHLCLAFMLSMAASSCVADHDSVVHTAAGATTPWSCDAAATTVETLGRDRYRLTGCDQTRVYGCDFSAPPSRCWPMKDTNE